MIIFEHDYKLQPSIQKSELRLLKNSGLALKKIDFNFLQSLMLGVKVKLRYIAVLSLYKK